MSNGMSPRIRHIVSGLAAVAMSALLLSTVVNSFDTRLIQQPTASTEAVSAVVATLARDALGRRS